MALTSEAFLIDNGCEIQGVGAILGTPPDSFGGRGYFVMEAPEPASAPCFCMCHGASRNPTRAFIPHTHLSCKQEPEFSLSHSKKPEVPRILSKFQAQWPWGVTTLNLRSLRRKLLSQGSQGHWGVRTSPVLGLFLGEARGYVREVWR